MPILKILLYLNQNKHPFNKYLEKVDLVEIAIREPLINNKQEKQIILLLYDNLSIPTLETIALYKLLIYYEQIQTFELLLFSKGDRKIENKEEVNTKILKDIPLGRNDDDNVYDVDEIISDAFSYAITLNKLHISFYLFKKYEDDVYGNKFIWIKSLVDSFRSDDTSVHQLMYLEERLFILEKFMKHIEYKMGFEFLTVLHGQIMDEPKDNFLVFWANPLKIILILLNISIHISTKHQNLKFKAQRFRSTLWDIANSIIDSSSNMNEVEDMLTDVNYSGTQVIDMIAFLDIIEILQNPMLDSIISNMYYGPYQREVFLKKSTCYKVIEEQTNDSPGGEGIISKSFKFFGFNHSFKTLENVLRTKTKVFKQLKELCFKNENPMGSMEDAEVNVGHAFQLQVWKKALDVKYQFDLAIILIASFLMLWYGNSLVDNENNIRTLYKTITDLESQPQTDDVIASLANDYSKMGQYSDQYLIDLYALLIISSLTLAYIIKDVQELVYARMRNVFIQFFTVETILNLSNAIIVIFWIYKHFTSLGINLSSVRYELRAYEIINRMVVDNTFNI